MGDSAGTSRRSICLVSLAVDVLRQVEDWPAKTAAVGGLRGSPAAGLEGTLDDLLRLGAELQRPRLVATETLAEATSVQFPGLVGVLPEVGRMDPNDWGLGFELRDAKSPHWTGTRNSPRTFGHFGGSGSFLWIDPAHGPGLACMCDLDFGPWALEAW